MARKIPRLETLEDRLNPSGLLDRYFHASENLGSFEQNRSQPSIVFLDESLMDRVPQEEFVGSTVITINQQSDPIDQMTEALSGLSNVEVVRIISHGRDGTLIFGDTLIGENQLRIHERQLNGWANALKPGGDILLYGCSVASTEVGRHFVARFASMTQADVAASSNPTGARGDLILEYGSGPVQGSLVATQTAWEASGVQLPVEGDFEYSTSGGNVIITGYTGAGGVVTVPSTLGGLPVTTIGSHAFAQRTSITTITLPNSITSIGDAAFSQCTGLTSITLPNSIINIGNNGAFGGCTRLTTITLPNSITNIGWGAFSGCTGLTSINLPNTITNIGENAFIGCTSLTGITLPNSVTTIGIRAFQSCRSLTSISLSNSLTAIGGQAFWECTSLTTITLPNSLTTIGVQAFLRCSSLTSLTLSNSLTTISYGSFYECTGLTSITLPNTVTTIEDFAFYRCTGLTTIYSLGNAPLLREEVFSSVNATVYYIPATTGWTNPWGGLTTVALFNYTTNGSVISITGYNGPGPATAIPNMIAGLPVTSIGDNAFKNQNILTSITLPNSITSIRLGAFSNCTSLTSINLGNSVATIWRLAFDNCTSLTNFTFPSSLVSIGDDAFSSCTSLSSITLPDSVISLGSNAFGNCFGLTRIILGNSLITIGSNAFANCFGLTSIILPNSLSTLGDYAFRDCRSLPGITLPNSLTTIGKNAFEGCTFLATITLPASVTLIGESPFHLCSSLNEILVAANNPNYSSSLGILYNKDQTTAIQYPMGKAGTITLPSTVTSIGNFAFSYSPSLSSITLPNSLTTIGYGAFRNCSLTSITLPNSVTTIGIQAFVNCTSLTSVTLGSSVKTIGESAFSLCPSLTSITLPNSVTNIGWGAFAYSSSLTSITLGNGITSIGNYAFYDCYFLDNIYALGNAPALGYGVFSGVPATLYYYRSATGFTNPWGGLTTVARDVPTTTTTLASLPTTSVYGDSITLTTTVVASLGVATGTVTFKDGSTVLGTANLDGSGGALFTISTLAAGNHSLITEYNGTTDFTTSVSAPLAFTVLTKSLTITANNKSKMYGNTLPAFTTTITGLVNGDTPSVISGLTLTTTALDSSNVGTYPITPAGATSANYAITLVNGTLTVTKAALTITADDKSKIYGDTLPTLTATYSGLVNGDTSTAISGLTLTTTALASSNVGTYPITPAGATSANYAISLVNGTLTVTKAALTITADDKSKIYGATLPTLTATYSGLVNGDTSSAISGLVLSTTALASSNVGTYPITAANAASGNYAITLVNGTLTVTKAALTITTDDKSKIYGAALPTLTATYSGLVNGDTSTAISGLTLTTTALASSNVGTYLITPVGATSGNYSITLVNGTLTITKAALTITANDKSKVYGDALPTLTASYSGLVNGDTSAAISGLTLTTTALASSNVGIYPITAANAASGNYGITLVHGTLTVTKAALTITADDKSKVYGDALPTFTASFSGLVNGDTSAAISGLTLTTTALASSNFGTYPITATGASSPNYDITLVGGNLTVTKAELTITADLKTKVYGQSMPQLTLVVSGLVNGDKRDQIANLGVGTAALASSPVGNYDLIPTGTNDNYKISYNNAVILITRAPLTITGPNLAKVYGDATPTLVPTVFGLVNGDTNANLSGLGAISQVLSGSSVGTYPVTVLGTNPNYDITKINGSILVTPAKISVRAENKSFIRGLEPLPAFTYAISGFVNGDNGTQISGAPILSSNAQQYSPFGNYPISVDVSKMSNPNYTFEGLAGTLSINKVATSIIPVESIPILTTTNGAANGITIWGAGGKKLGTLNPYPGYTGRIVTAVGDLNGDGVVDIITGVGAGTSPLLRRFDGRTLKEIGQGFYAYDKAFMGGMSVAAADVDGDGLFEIITGTGNGSAPHVKVRKMDGTITASFYAYAPEFTRGVNLITGDIDGDSKAEIVSTPNWGGGPHVKVFDGKGKASASFFAYETTFIGGFSLALADTDGNGTKEIVTESYAGRITSGRIFDPKGKMLREWFPHGTISSGGMVIAADLNGDKIDEIVSVALPGSPSILKVFDGGLKQTASTLPYGASYTNGISIKAVDLNADGIKEIVTAPKAGLPPQVRRFDGTLKVLDSLFATATSFTGGIWLD